MEKKFFTKFCSVLIYIGLGLLWGFPLSYFDETLFFVGRNPAAVNFNKVFDFSHLSGNALQNAIRHRVISHVSIEKSENGSGFSMGNFVFLNSRGEKKSACGEYSQIHLTFEAEGESANGKKPIMDVMGRCRATDDLSVIQPLMIPIGTLMNEPASDSEFIFEDRDNLYLKFKDLNQNWPHRWIMKSIQLNGPSVSSPLIFEQLEITSMLGRTPVMIW